MDSAVFIFESNDEVSSSEYWVVILVVRCCCGDGLVMLLCGFISIGLLFLQSLIILFLFVLSMFIFSAAT